MTNKEARPLAEQLVNKEKYEEAVALYTGIISGSNSVTERAKAYCNRGLIYARYIKSYSEAVDDFKQSIKLAKTKDIKEADKSEIFHTAYCNLGLTYRELDLYDDAINIFIESIEKLGGKKDIHIHDIHLNLGSTYVGNGNYDKAIEHYLKSDPEDYDTNKNLGYVYAVTGKHKMALECYKKAHNVASEIHQKKEFFFDNLVSLHSIKKAEFILNGLLDIPDDKNLLYRICAGYFKDTKKYGYVYSLCKKLYMQTLQIMQLLFIEPSELYVTHHTSMEVTEKLLCDGNKLRMGNMDKMNDTTEGEILLRYLGLSIKPPEDTYRYGIAYGVAFSFAINSLNQFRLYGKNAGKEATGLCLVFKRCFFADRIKNPVEYRFNSEFGDAKDDGKHSLFRCVYIDSSGDILSIGESDDERKKNKKAFTEIKKSFAKLKRIVNEIKNNWSGCDIGSDGILCEQLILDLLLNIRYLVKDASYREERECRIVNIENIEDYLEATSVKKYISRVYYGSEVEKEVYEYDGKGEAGSVKLDKLRKSSGIENISSHHPHRNK